MPTGTPSSVIWQGKSPSRPGRPACGQRRRQEEEPRGGPQERRPGVRPGGTPEQVNVYDFPDKELDKAIPYGIYDVSANTGLAVTVAHLPPGTSKWNKIEHRLFSQITLNWQGRPLTSHQVIVDLIANTTTATGLSVRRPGHRPIPLRHQRQRQRHRRTTPGTAGLPRRMDLHPAARRHAVATGRHFSACP